MNEMHDARREMAKAWLYGYEAAADDDHTIDSNPYGPDDLRRIGWRQGFEYNSRSDDIFRRPWDSPYILPGEDLDGEKPA